MLTIVTLLLLLLLSVAAQDAYTACKCVRRRLHNKPCPDYIKHVVPACAPGADSTACHTLCCAACAVHGNNWPVCRSAMLRNFCIALAMLDNDAGTVGPKPDDAEPKTGEEGFDISPSEHPEPYPSEEPSQSPEDVEPTAAAGDDVAATPVAEPAPVNDERTRKTPKVKPKSGPPRDGEKPSSSKEKSAETSGKEPPFDATNEGELDLTPATEGRPFAPAACECMSKGTACDGVLAAASGVCEAGIDAVDQGEDCKFACCRICVVNMYATFCDDEGVVLGCGL